MNFYRTETGCKDGDEWPSPHHKVGERPNEKPRKGYYSLKKKRKRQQECGGYFKNCTTIGLRLARHESIGFSKRKTAPEKPDAKSWDHFQKYVSFSLLHVMQVSVKTSTSAKSQRNEI